MSLPTGWIDAALKDIVAINPANPDTVSSDDTLVSFVPMALVEELTGRLDSSKHRPWREVKKGFSKFQEGDVVVAKITPSMENGKAAIAHGLANGLGAGTTELHILRPRQGIEPRFLLHYVLQESFRRQARARMTGTAGQLRVPTAFLEEQRIPLPPAAEQARIVETLDSMLSRLDSAVASLEAAQRKLTAYRASVLKAAVEGRLVPTEADLARRDGRSYEPADVLLQRILKERRRRWEEADLAKMRGAGKVPKDDRWKAKYSEPEALEVDNLPALPDGWCWASLDQLIVEPLANGKSVPDGQGFPVLRLTSIRAGRVDLAQRKAGAWGDLAPGAYTLKKGDLLIVRGNGSVHLVGRAGLVNADADDVAYPDTLIRARVVPEALLPELLAYVWDSPPVRIHMESRAKTTAGIHKVNQTDLAQTPIPLAPLAEQQRIKEEIDRLLSVSSAVSEQALAASARSGRLRQSVLQSAFEGLLVDQDPSDEAADVLVARIRAEREADIQARPRAKRSRKLRAAS